MKPLRAVNLDLLRIVCMLMIITSHFLIHGGVLDSVKVWSFDYFTTYFIRAFLYVLVNCFVMISGYFLCTSPFRLRKWVSLYGQAFFYSVFLYVLLVIFNVEPFSVTELIKSILVFTMDRYWFVTAYLLLYLVMPFLNYAINAMDKKAHMISCVIALIIFSLLPNIVYFSDFSNIQGGYSFIWFSVLYIIGAYIRKYVGKNKNVAKFAVVGYITASVIVAASKFLLQWITPLLFGKAIGTNLFFAYNSVPVAVASICMFLIFLNITIPEGKFSKLISFVSPLVFGVYLIHDHPNVRTYIWQDLIKPDMYIGSGFLYIYLIICVFGIFIFACMIDWLRKTLVYRCGFFALIGKVCDTIENIVIIKSERYSRGIYEDKKKYL